MRISIVTISYNQGAFLPHLIRTLRPQLVGDDEHIIVDPGSIDDSREIISEYAKCDARVIPIFEPDSGPADGLNRGFAAATREVVCYVNADDWLVPSALAFVRKFFHSRQNIDVLLGAVKIAEASGAIRWRGRIPDLPTRRRLVSGVFQYYQQGTFFTKKMYNRIPGFNKLNRTCWDRELIVDMALNGARFATTGQPLGCFRIHCNSITGRATNNLRYGDDSLRILRKTQARLGGAASPMTERILEFESKFNPLRILKQFRPIL